MALPHYYSNLRPFRESFRSGVPILTYHHVGPRSRGARLKGLYLSPRLFARQMRELTDAGFETPPFDRLPTEIQTRASGTASSMPVFLTFDDGFVDIFEHALPVLKERKLRGMVYLVANLIGKSNLWQQKAGDVVEPLMDEAQIREWLAAGQQIGSHTLTHPRLTQVSNALAREEISASRKSLEDRFGLPIEHFCYPYGDMNEAIKEMAHEAGYKTACTTQTGFNQSCKSPLALERITARYPSRNLKALWRRLWE